MCRHPENAAIQSYGCLILAMCKAWKTLAHDGDSDAQEIETAVNALRLHPKTKAVVTNGMMALAGAAYRSRAGQAACMSPLTAGSGESAVDVVLELMGRFLTDTEIQRAGCIMLKNVTKPLNKVSDEEREDDDDGSGDKDDGGDGTAPGAASENMCRRIAGAVVEALQVHKDDAALQALCVLVLRNVACAGPAGARACGLRHGTDLVLGVMEHFPGDPAVQATGCKALAAVGMGTREAEAVARVLGQYPGCEQVQAHGCRALLACIAAVGTGPGTDAWVLRGSEAAMDAMTKFPGSLRMQLAGCRLLTFVGNRNNNNNNNNNNSGRMIELADAVLRRFPGQRTAVESALGIIANSAVRQRDTNAVGPGVVRSICAVLARHPAAESIQELCYSTLANATFHNGPNAAAFEAAGGVQALVGTLRTFANADSGTGTGSATTSLLSWAVNLLGNVARKCQDAIRESGAVELLVAAMAAHPEHDLIQRNGCYALAGIAEGRPADKRRVAEAGGADAVVAALCGEYPESSGHYIRQWGCCALAALAQGSPEHAALVGAAGGVEAVMAAMARNPRDQQVQLYGSWALENTAAAASEHAENETVATTAVGLLCSAMIAFEDDVQIQLHCLSALERLAPTVAAVPATKTCCGLNEGMLLVRVNTALAVHIENAPVVLCGCRAFEAFSCCASPWPERMASTTGLIMHVLEKYAPSSAIQRACLATLNNVVEAAGPAVCRGIIPDAIVDSLEKHLDDSIVLGSGFALLERIVAAIPCESLPRAIKVLLRITGDFSSGGDALETLLCGCRITATVLSRYGQAPEDPALARSAVQLFSSALLVLCTKPQDDPHLSSAGASTVSATRSIYAALCSLAAKHYGVVIAEGATGAIAHSMQNRSCAELRAAGCAALEVIASHRVEGKDYGEGDRYKADAFRAILDALRAFPEDTRVQLNGCGALAALADGDPAFQRLAASPSTTSASSAISLLVARAGKGVCEASVRVSALSTLAAVVRCCPEAQACALSCGGLEAVVSAVIGSASRKSSNSSDNNALFIASLKALTALTAGCPEAQAAVAAATTTTSSNDGSNDLAATLRSAITGAAKMYGRDPAVLEACMRACLGLSGRDGSGLHSLAEDKAGVRSLATMLKRWSQQGYPNVVAAGLKLLGAAYAAGHGKALAESGVPELATSLLLTSPDAAMCARCLHFIAEMARHSPVSADAFLAMGGLGAVANALAAHTDAAAAATATTTAAVDKLKARGAAAVGALALFSQERAAEICAGGGLEFLKRLMRENSQSAAVQEQGALALSYVLADSMVHKRYCAEVDAIGLVAKAARAFPASPLIEASLYALKRLLMEQRRAQVMPQYVFYSGPDRIFCEACWKKYQREHPEEVFRVFFLPWRCDTCSGK